MPLLVTKSCPSRNALLLFGSSQDSVPGTNVGYSSFAYSSAFIVSGLSMVTLLSLSTSLPPNDQTSHWHHVLPSPVALPKAIPAGVPFSFRALHILRNPSLSTRPSMPYFSVNLATFFMYWSMSPCTNRLQRSTRSLAPFSGTIVYCCATASVGSNTEPVPSAVPAATPAVALRKSRRLKS